MAIKLEIHPSSTSVDMLGPPDPSSAYSLSGHIVLSLPSSNSRFERRRAARILLRSLVITFEGQAELVMQEAGYAAARLCSISKELVSKTTVELSNEGDEDGAQPCAWHVTFDLPVPGWLPASDQYGDCREGYSGTQYNLYATVKYTNLEESSLGSSWVSALCTPFSSKTKVVHAEQCGITLNRFAFPLPSSASQVPAAFFSVTTNAQSLGPEDNPHPIPADIVSKIELLASVPEHISLDDERFPFALSIRASSLSESEAAKLRVSHMSLELQQIDEYTSSADSYAARHPLPSPKEQPPHKALRDAHPLHALYDVGLLAPLLPSGLDDSHSLLAGVDRIDIPFDSADHARKCAEGMHPKHWFTIESKVPFTHSPSVSRYHRHHHKKDDPLEWMGTPRLRATSQGPFFGVRHALRAIVVLSYGAPADGEPSPPKSLLAFTLPLSFVRFRCAARSRSPTPLSTPELSPSSGTQALPTTMVPSQPYDMAELPAYSQLFYSNGDARHDDSIPLPVYTPPAVSLLTSGDVSEDGYTSSEDSCLLQSPASSDCHSL